MGLRQVNGAVLSLLDAYPQEVTYVTLIQFPPEMDENWLRYELLNLGQIDRIPSTTPGAEPPRDAKDSGSARPHSTHLETSSTNRS